MAGCVENNYFHVRRASGNAGLGGTTVNTLTMVGEPTTTVAILKSDGSLWQDGPGVGLQLLSPAGTILSTSAVADASGFTDVYAVTADKRLWEHSSTGWALLSVGSFQQISAATNSAGNAVVFAVLTDNSLWENSSLFPGNHWQILSPAGTILSISAVTDAAGRDDVYAVTADSHLWEHTPSGWALLSTGSFRQISAGLNAMGQAIVFGVRYGPLPMGEQRLLENLSPAGTILSVSAGGADDVFAITADNRLWEHTAGWAILSTGSFASLSGAKNTAGQGDVFAVLTDTSFWEYDPAFPGLAGPGPIGRGGCLCGPDEVEMKRAAHAVSGFSPAYCVRGSSFRASSAQYAERIAFRPAFLRRDPGWQ